jgi:hypothetical protein
VTPETAIDAINFAVRCGYKPNNATERLYDLCLAGTPLRVGDVI